MSILTTIEQKAVADAKALLAKMSSAAKAEVAKELPFVRAHILYVFVAGMAGGMILGAYLAATF